MSNHMIFMSKEELEQMSTCDHSYLILLNDKLRISQDNMKAEIDELSHQISEYEREEDRMEKSLINLRGITKNFIEVNKLYKIKNNTHKDFIRQMETHSTYLHTELSKYQMYVDILTTFFLFNALISMLIVFDVLGATSVIVVVISQYAIIWVSKRLSPFKLRDERAILIKTNYTEKLSGIVNSIKKINKSIDFLNELVELV